MNHPSHALPHAHPDFVSHLLEVERPPKYNDYIGTRKDGAHGHLLHPDKLQKVLETLQPLKTNTAKSSNILVYVEALETLAAQWSSELLFALREYQDTLPSEKRGKAPHLYNDDECFKTCLDRIINDLNEYDLRKLVTLEDSNKRDYTGQPLALVSLFSELCFFRDHLHRYRVFAYNESNHPVMLLHQFAKEHFKQSARK